MTINKGSYAIRRGSYCIKVRVGMPYKSGVVRHILCESPFMACFGGTFLLQWGELVAEIVFTIFDCIPCQQSISGKKKYTSTCWSGCHWDDPKVVPETNSVCPRDEAGLSQGQIEVSSYLTQRAPSLPLGQARSVPGTNKGRTVAEKVHVSKAYVPDSLPRICKCLVVCEFAP